MEIVAHGSGPQSVAATLEVQVGHGVTVYLKFGAGGKSHPAWFTTWEFLAFAAAVLAACREHNAEAQ